MDSSSTLGWLLLGALAFDVSLEGASIGWQQPKYNRIWLTTQILGGHARYRPCGGCGGLWWVVVGCGGLDSLKFNWFLYQLTLDGFLRRNQASAKHRSHANPLFDPVALHPEATFATSSSPLAPRADAPEST